MALETSIQDIVNASKCNRLDIRGALNSLVTMIGSLWSQSSDKIIVNAGGSSFSIPEYDYIQFTYVGGGASDDDLIASQIFKKGGASGDIVATLTYAYVGATNNIGSITLTL